MTKTDCNENITLNSNQFILFQEVKSLVRTTNDGRI